MAAVMPMALFPLPLQPAICIPRTFHPIAQIPQNRTICFNGKMCKAVRWTPPPVGWVKLNVDGSSKGNPGQAAAGGICRTSQGKWLFGFTTRIGFQNSLVAELHAIMQGLQMAWNSGFRLVVIESDCKVAVDKILGHHDEDGHDLTSKLVIMCRQLLQRNWHCNLMHIYREGNSCADFLASNFQHLPMGETVHLRPPPDLLKLLGDDFTANEKALRLVRGGGQARSWHGCEALYHLNCGWCVLVSFCLVWEHRTLFTIVIQLSFN